MGGGKTNQKKAMRLSNLAEEKKGKCTTNRLGNCDKAGKKNKKRGGGNTRCEAKKAMMHTSLPVFSRD